MKKLYTTLLTVVLATTASAQTIIYVDADATGNNDGTSWANAYNDLYVALYVTSNDPTYTGTQIWIAEGFYTRLSQNQTFDVNNDVLLYGGFEGTESSIDARDIENHPTIISGDVDWNDTGVPGSSNLSMGQNAANIFRVLSPNRALFDGLIIEHAFSTTASGGGINVVSQTLHNLQISNSILRENVSFNRAGVLYYAYENSSFYLFNNRIEDNVNTDGASSYTIEFRAANTNSIEADVHFVNNLFKHNTSESSFQMGTCARFTAFGGSEIDLLLTNNTFVNNPQTGYNANNISSLIVYEHAGGGSSLYTILNNNIFFNNPGVTDIFGESISGSSQTGSLDVNNTSSNQNVQDFTDNLNLQNTYVSNSTPFVDYANGDYTPIAAYQTIGNSTYYSSQFLNDPYLGQEYPMTDLAGNPRFNAQGQIAIGAYQPAINASLSEEQELDFSIYPNPAEESITIHTADLIEGELKILNTSGKVVLTTSMTGVTNHVNLQGLARGTYYVQFMIEDQAFNSLLLVR